MSEHKTMSSLVGLCVFDYKYSKSSMIIRTLLV